MVIVIYSFWFKTDSDTSDFEASIGKMKVRTAEMVPLNEGMYKLYNSFKSEEYGVPIGSTSV